MAPDFHDPETSRPTGRMRLAAALGGAGVLAVGLGSGVIQARSDGADPGAVGEGALATAQQPPARTAVAEPAGVPNPNVSSTPLAAPAPAGSGPSDAVATEPQTPATPPAGRSETPAPAPAEPPSPAEPAVPAPAAEQPAPPAAEAAPAAAPPAAEPTGTTPPAAEPKAEKDEPLAGCEDDEEEVMTLQGDADEIVCMPEEDERRPAPERRAAARKDAKPGRTSRPPLRNAEGVPTAANPTTSIALPGAAPIGVPNFFIDKFRIPPFLLSIYQAAGVEYGIRWEILAAINEIETDYGRNLNVSSAGALGWMQFMPATWKAYGVDANGDKKKDPYNPVDAIFAAARYLKAAGGEKDLRKAIFAYNHADWYVDSVLMRARLIGGLPTNLVGSLTGLTQGMFPVHARARYADDLSEREASKRIAKGRNAALPVESEQTRRGINIYAKPGSPVVSVQDGRIVKMGRTDRLGRFIKLRDVYGNTYTYAHLASIADRHPVPKAKSVSDEEVRKELKLPKKDPKPTRAASAGTQRKTAKSPSSSRSDVAKNPNELPQVRKQRLFADPKRPAAWKAGGQDQVLDGAVMPGSSTFDRYFVEDFGLKPEDVELRRLKVGSKVIGGTILGRIGKTSETVAPHVLFEVRPAGRGAPRIDPKPILDGWKLLESTAIYRAKGKNPFFGRDGKAPTIGQILLMGKEELQERVLHNPRVEIYGQGREDIRGGRIDRRVLATLEFLAGNGLRPSVSSLLRPGAITTSGNVSHHSSGSAVDIAAINGVPIAGNQGKGSVTDTAVRQLITLQGTMKPAQIISLLKFDGVDNTIAMADHYDHIHVGFQPEFDPNSKEGRQISAALKPGQWIKLIDRLGEIDNPTVRAKPSDVALDVKPARATRTRDGG